MRRVLSATIRMLVLAALIAMGFAAVRKQLRDGNDFPIYWQAARDLLAHRSPYDITSGLHGYVYLPWFALVLAPLARLPLPAAAAGWYAANLVFLGLALRLAIDAVRDALPPSPRERVATVLGSLPLVALAHDNLVLGQANLLLLLLLVLAARSAAAKPGWLAGVPVGFAAALKMPAAVLLLPLVLRAPRAAAGFAAAVALALLLPLAVTGPRWGRDLLGEWRAKVVTPAAAGTLQGSSSIDQSPAAALRRWLVAAPAFDGRAVNIAALAPATFARVSRAVGAAVLLFYMAVWWRAPGRAAPGALLLDLALGCCAMVQITGFSLKAQFIVLLLPALAATWSASSVSRRAPRVLLALGALAFLVTQPGLVGRPVASLLLAHSAMTLGTLLLTVALVLQRLAVTPPPSAGRGAARAAGTAS